MHMFVSQEKKVLDWLHGEYQNAIQNCRYPQFFTFFFK